MAAISAFRVTQHRQIFSLSLEIKFNALRFINYTIPRLCSTYVAATKARFPKEVNQQKKSFLQFHQLWNPNNKNNKQIKSFIQLTSLIKRKKDTFVESARNTGIKIVSKFDLRNVAAVKQSCHGDKLAKSIYRLFRDRCFWF